MQSFKSILVVGAVCLGLAPAGYSQQQQSAEPITIQKIVTLALEQSPDHHLSALDVDAAMAGKRIAKTALLPNVSFGETAMRGNDPVYVFGARLRQQRFTQANFALDALNKPSPLSNFTTSLSGNWMAFDGWRTEFAMHQADLNLQRARSAATRADQAIVYRVVAAWEGVQMAAKQLEVTKQQATTAQALLDTSRNRVSAGLAVESDQLAAAANLAQRQQEVIAAEGGLSIAWAELERAAGVPIPDAQRQIPALTASSYTLPELSSAVTTAMQDRPDKQSLAQQTSASKLGVSQARSAFAPTLSVFGNWEADRGSFAGQGGTNWTTGAELRIDVLPFKKRQDLALAKISEARARAQETSADDQIRLEVTRAWYSQRAAAQMLDVAKASTAQTDESLRILKNRYEAGLATMTDVLRGEDAQRQSSASYWMAVSRNALAWADLKFAMGTLNSGNLSDLQ